ncbi:MAG TPA: cytochrome c [Candidatus Acidoferrum sp.]|nr:cytochrome c [Candidatus Acidoferrum sp.]
MTTKLAATLAGAALLGLTGPGLWRATAQEMDAETKARVERFEKGPATVDVSKYPEVIKSNYQLFSQKCSQCHKLSRPINSDYATPDEWSRYIKRMMYKPGSNISAADGKKIYEFLAYDSSIRKKTMLDEKLAKATADEKKDAETKIKELHDKYDAK